ncbi:MAG: hypothetical protein A3E87_04925 [Gammaproteobacteria bacterium RIFCSPHIGHO2_12_FULL_35_23]|nr:MAG: hypothetical protein A3E87_04925 [Gammaproteobacteria bacterium RIFCSPHIGHO2_12_FULL_35_23]
MKGINFGIIGCGRVAIRHIEAIQLASNAKLIAVCDGDKARAEEKSLLGNVPFYVDYHEMFKQHPEIQVVIILTPSGSHYEHAVDIISRYQKHLVIEKPFVMTIAEGLTLKLLADKASVKIFPVYQNRCNKAVQFVKNAINQGELGAVRVGTVRVRWCRPQRYYNLSPWRGTWAMDGGAMTNQGIHYIDLLRYICGEITRVHAKLATLGAEIEVEDTGVAIVEFASGAVGVIEIMTSARPDDFEASISAVCENGLAVISGIATNILQTFSPNPAKCQLESENFKDAYGFGHNKVIEEVANSILYDKQFLVEFDDGLQTIKLLHAIYRSDELGTWVEVNEAKDSKRLGVPDEALLQLYRTSTKEHETAL